MRVILLGILSVALSYAQDTVCDPLISRYLNRSDPDRYRQRKGEDRCEGVYNDPINTESGSLWVASLVSGSFPAKWEGPLKLQWRSYGENPATIQGYSLRPYTRYRLDTRTTGTSYSWPTDRVNRYLQPADTGFVAFSTVNIEGRPARVYLPLAQNAQPAAPYRLTMISTTDLAGASVLVSPVGGGKPLHERKKLSVGSIVRGQPFPVELPPFPRPGLYRVDVIGQRRTSGSVTAAPPVILYHP